MSPLSGVPHPTGSSSLSSKRTGRFLHNPLKYKNTTPPSSPFHPLHTPSPLHIHVRSSDRAGRCGWHSRGGFPLWKWKGRGEKEGGRRGEEWKERVEQQQLCTDKLQRNDDTGYLSQGMKPHTHNENTTKYIYDSRLKSVVNTGAKHRVSCSSPHCYTNSFHLRLQHRKIYVTGRFMFAFGREVWGCSSNC